MTKLFRHCSGRWQQFNAQKYFYNATFIKLQINGIENDGEVYSQTDTTMQLITLPTINPDASFDEILQGQVRCGGLGEYYHIQRSPQEFSEDFTLLETELQRVLPFLEARLKRNIRLEDLLFIDIETTGLSSSRPLFLIGTLSFDAQPRLQLFLARQHQEEAAILEAFSALAAGKVLVSFNGRSFDWPYIENRCNHHSLPQPRPRAHFDLLPHARKHWKKHLPNCRLQTLEKHYCRRQRQGDIPSSRIPACYQSFTLMHGTSGSGAPLLLPLIHHNYWDVLTMAELLIKVTQPVAASL